MTPEEREEFSKLKFIRAERGFWLPSEQERYNELFDLHAVDFKLKMMAIDHVLRQVEQN
jgi:hypothetical protein